MQANSRNRMRTDLVTPTPRPVVVLVLDPLYRDRQNAPVQKPTMAPTVSLPHHTPRILILGASGKLGRMICNIWRDAHDLGFYPVPVVRNSQPNSICWSLGAPFPDIDSIEAVFALWGVTSGDDRALAVNRDLALSAQDLALKVGARLVVHCSTAAVYGGVTTPLREDVSCAPSSAYGRAKLDMESAIFQSIDVTHDAPCTVVFRIGNVAGAESLFRNLRPGGAVTLDRFADGCGPERSYLAPHDLANVLVSTWRNEITSGIYNLSAPNPTRMQDIVLAAGASVEWRDAPETAIQSIVLDTRRLARTLPEVSLPHDPSVLVESARLSGVWP